MTSKTRSAVVGYLFVLPWIVGFLVFKAWPIFRSLFFSFTEVTITATEGILTAPAGIDHYTTAFVTDIQFVDQLLTFLRNTVVSTPIILVFSLIIAMLINYPMRLRGLFRTIFFLPVVIASGPVMEQLVTQGAATIPTIEQYGIFQMVEANLHPSIAEPVTYVLSQIILILWFSGVQILVFLAGLQKMNTSMYEAARIDGASSWEIFWKLTLPELRPLIVVNGIFTIVTLATFARNEVIVHIRAQMFEPTTGFGYASALAWIYFVVVAVLLVVATLLLRGRRRYRV